MKRGLLSLCAVASLCCVAACSGGGDDTPAASLSTATTRHTTTTLSVEAEVEAAYLRSWDVYADAVRTFDTSKLGSVYTADALKLRLDEVARLKSANTPAKTVVTHNITKIELLDSGEAVVHDDYENHSVLLNGTSGEAIEPDPSNVVKRQYGMRRESGTWKIWLVIAS